MKQITAILVGTVLLLAATALCACPNSKGKKDGDKPSAVLTQR